MKSAATGLLLVTMVTALTCVWSHGAWQVWKTEHAKVYPSPAHEAKARGVWLRHRDLVTSHNNRADVTFTMAMNKFADQERKSGASLLLTLSKALRRNNNSNPTAPPPSFDWRLKGAISPVKNQGQMGSSDAYAVTEDLESYHAIKTGQLVSLSVKEVSDCCAATAPPSPMLRRNVYECIHDLGGLCTQADYPPGPTCGNNSCTAVPDAATKTVHVTRNESRMLEAVLEVPLVVYLDASRPSFQLYTKGVYQDKQCSASRLDHALQLVGYGEQDGTPYWILKNSWGVDWGMDGYILLKRGVNMCGVAELAIYPQ